MAYVLSSLVTRVQQRVRDTGYSSSEIVDYINDTQRDVLVEYEIPLTEATQNYTVTTNVADITNGNGLPDDFQVAINLIDTTSGQEKTIPYKDYHELDQLYGDLADTTLHPPGQPSCWYLYGGVIYLFPAPKAAYTLTLRYYKSPPLLSSDADVPLIPEAFGELLVRGAAARVLQAKDMYDQAAVHENKYEELVLKLVNRYGRRQRGRATQMRINRYQMPNRQARQWRY